MAQIIFLSLFLLFRLVHWLWAEPNADEAYYWWWAQNPSLSYFDHPPLMAWLQTIVTNLLGDSRFSLRCLNVVTNGIFFYTYWQILRYLRPDDSDQEIRRSLLDLGLIVASSPLFFIMLSLAWHDHLMICLGLASCYEMVRFLDDYKFRQITSDRRLYLATALLGLALITKHNSVFIGVAFLITILRDRKLRPLVTLRRVCLCGLILLVIFSPVLVWNYQHDFPAFRFYADRSVEGRGVLMQALEVVGFLFLSALLLSPFITWQLGKLWTNHQWNLVSFTNKNTVFYELALHNFLASTISLIMLAGLSTAYYYWNITGYLLLFPLLVIPKNYLPQKALQRIIGFGLLFSLLFTVNSTLLPIGALFSQDADQDGRILFGWGTVATAIQTNFPEVTTVATTDYRSASALAFRSPHLTVTVLSQRITHFDFVPLANQPQLLLWDDWYPLSEWHKARLADRNLDRPFLDRRITVPIYQSGVFLKNYYLVPLDAVSE